jgi:hypothetical protein
MYTLAHLYSAEHTAAAATAAGNIAPPQQEAHINGKDVETTVDSGASHPATSALTPSTAQLPPGAIVLRHSSFHWGSGGEGSNVHSSNGAATVAGSNCWSCCAGGSERHSSAAVTAPPQGNHLFINTSFSCKVCILVLCTWKQSRGDAQL